MVLQETEVGGGHIVRMSHKEREGRRPGRHLGDEGRFTRLGRFPLSDRQGVTFKERLEKLIEGARWNALAEREIDLVDQCEQAAEKVRFLG